VKIHPQDVAKKLLEVALGVSVTTADGRTITPLGGRTGEGGEIKMSPYVEIADSSWRIEGIAAGYGSDRVTARFGVIYWVKYSQNVDADKEVLRLLFEALYDAVKAKPTLDGLVDHAFVAEADNGLNTATDYWFWVTIVEVEFET